MSEEQVTITIAVLNAYADGTLRTDQCDDLDEALIKAYDAWVTATADADSDETYSNFGYASESADE